MGELHWKCLLHASSAVDTEVTEWLRTDCNKQRIKKKIHPVISFFPLLSTENSPHVTAAKFQLQICLQSTAPLPEGQGGTAWKDSEPCQYSCKVCDIYDNLSPFSPHTPHRHSHGCLQSTAPLPEGRGGTAWKDSEPCQSPCKVCDICDNLPFPPTLPRQSYVEVISASRAFSSVLMLSSLQQPFVSLVSWLQFSGRELKNNAVVGVVRIAHSV